jgi:hypothetical protein
MTLDLRRTDGELWESPGPDKSYQDPLKTLPDPDLNDDEEVPLFQDEEIDGSDQKTHTCSRYPGVKLALLVLAGLAVLVALPIIVLAVDKHKAKHRMQAPGAIQVQGVSVDVSRALPVVGLNVTIQKSAFPKLTTVQPQTIECMALDADWGRVWLATVQELEDHAAVRQFYINATMNLPEENADTVLQAFAIVAWQVITQQTTYVGPYKCYLHLHAKIAGFIGWHSTQSQRGVIDLKEVWQVRTPTLRKPKNISPVAATTTTTIHPMFTPFEEDDDDYTTHRVEDNLMTQYLPSYNSNSSQYSEKHDEATQPPTPPSLENNQNDLPTEDASALPETQQQQQQQQQRSYIEVHQVSAEGIVLGFRLQIPQSILDAIPAIRVHLPMLALVAQLTGATQSIQLSLEEMDLSFSSENNHHNGLAEISCGDGQFANNNNNCAWYSPLVQILQDTVNQKQDNRTLNLYVQADNSFLQRMVGPHHAMVVYHQKMAYQWYGTHHQPRRRELQDSLEVECVLAQSALFGDIFDFRWCMNLKLSEGIALDGYINLYGYGGSWKGELEWQRAGKFSGSVVTCRVVKSTNVGSLTANIFLLKFTFHKARLFGLRELVNLIWNWPERTTTP